MSEKTFRLEIITAGKVVFQDEATSVTAPGTMGGFQVLYDHAPLISTMEIGEIKVMDKNGNKILFATSGGFVEVNENAVVVLAETAELASQIDTGRAKASGERASLRITSAEVGLDVERAQQSMRRSLNRLRVASKA